MLCQAVTVSEVLANTVHVTFMADCYTVSCTVVLVLNMMTLEH